MISTFLLVTAQAAKNRLWNFIRRLREPRYLVGTIAGVAYMWAMFFRNTGRATRALPNLPLTDITTAAASLVVLCLLIVPWALPSDSGGLEFSESEIAFLFPAPLRRRDLLVYKIIRAQPQVFFSAMAFTVFGWARGNLFVGMWVVFSVLSVYFTMVSLGRARLRLAGLGFLARLAAVGAIFGGLWWYASSLLPLSISGDFVKVMRQIASPFQTPFVRVLLFIPRLFVGAAMPLNTKTLIVSCSALLVLGLILFHIAAALNISFQEASIEYSQRRAERLERLHGDRRGQRQVSLRMRPLFPLGETGAPEIAIVWKNVIALIRTSIAFLVLFVVALLFVIGEAIWLHDPFEYEVLGTMVTVFGGIFPLFAPLVFANDLRLDLVRAEVLKSYPISGERLVAAEIAAPLVVISILQIAFLSVGSILLHLGNITTRGARFLGTPQFVVVALLLAVPICAMQLLLRNAVPVFFPALAMQSKDEPRGIVTAGQRLISLAANILTLTIVLIPAAVVSLPSLWVAAHWFPNSPLGVAVATMPAIMVMATEVWIGLRILGTQFERLDVSNDFDIVVL